MSPSVASGTCCRHGVSHAVFSYSGKTRGSTSPCVVDMHPRVQFFHTVKNGQVLTASVYLIPYKKSLQALRQGKLRLHNSQFLLDTRHFFVEDRATKVVINMNTDIVIIGLKQVRHSAQWELAKLATKHFARNPAHRTM